jgi:RNA polymerase sigma-70 factor (ECF subfamily)
MNGMACEQKIFSAPVSSSGSNRWRARRAADLLAHRQELFENMLNPLTHVLHAAALQRHGDRALAEDLVQETCLYAWKNFDHFNLGTNFRAWVLKILFNLASNELRKVKHREKMAFCFMKEALRRRKNTAGNDNRDTDVDWERQYSDMVDDGQKMALDNLNENQRKVFMRVLLGGLSYHECAQEMNVPVGTIMSRLFRARRQLGVDMSVSTFNKAKRLGGKRQNVGAS